MANASYEYLLAYKITVPILQDHDQTCPQLLKQ